MQVAFPPFYYEVKLSQEVKDDCHLVFSSSALSLQMDKMEEGLWGQFHYHHHYYLSLKKSYQAWLYRRETVMF